MITIMRYKCGVCGAVYDSEKECMECETCHDTPTRINNLNYRIGERYPLEIEVDFNNSYPPVVYRRKDF